jgi:hypothetical protein
MRLIVASKPLQKSSKFSVKRAKGVEILMLIGVEKELIAPQKISIWRKEEVGICDPALEISLFNFFLSRQ